MSLFFVFIVSTKEKLKTKKQKSASFMAERFSPICPLLAIYKHDVRIEASSGLTEDEIEKMKADAEANAEADKKAKEKIDKLNEADSMIFQTEKQLKEVGDKLSDEKKKPVQDTLGELKKAYETKELEKIEPALDKLNETWKSVSEEMYKAQAEAQQGSQAQQGATGGQADGEGEGKKSDSKNDSDDVEDVDFEEVK